MPVAPLNTGTPTVAVGNYQFNSAAVTATTTTVDFGIADNMGTNTNASALRVNGNQVTATAVGNAAVLSITLAK